MVDLTTRVVLVIAIALVALNAWTVWENSRLQRELRDELEQAQQRRILGMDPLAKSYKNTVESKFAQRGFDRRPQ